MGGVQGDTSRFPDAEPARLRGCFFLILDVAEHPLLTIDKLSLRRGERELYAGLSARFDGGELWWLRGENGRGKTTLLRILAGFIAPESGQVSWRGEEFAARLDEPRQAISYLDDRLGLSRDLTVAQNLEFFAVTGSGRPAGELLLDLNLENLARRPVRQLSTGQKKRVGLARLLAEGSRVWLLDEPTNGLDEHNRGLLARLIEQHVTGGGLCVLASHDAVPVSGVPVQQLELH